MNVIDLLAGEHGVLNARFDHLASDLPAAANLEHVQRCARELAAVLASHNEIEERLLFQALEPHIGTAGPLLVVRCEHAEVRRALAAVIVAHSLDEAVERARSAVLAGRELLAKEERVVFDIARHSIPRAELEWLGEVWAAARGVEIELNCALTAH